MYSEQYEIQPGHEVPYYEETQKRSFKEKLKKIKNTILLLLAYGCPNNRLRIKFHKWRGVHIGKNVYLGMFCFLDNLYPSYIYIEDNASITAGSMIITHFDPSERLAGLFPSSVKPVLIKKGALVAVRSTILPGVTIGTNSIVSAGSVVETNVADNVIVRGNPAKKIVDLSEFIN